MPGPHIQAYTPTHTTHTHALLWGGSFPLLDFTHAAPFHQRLFLCRALWLPDGKSSYANTLMAASKVEQVNPLPPQGRPCWVLLHVIFPFFSSWLSGS